MTGGPANQISTAALGSLGNSRPTGIVVDDVSGHVYVGKAGTGILSFDAGTLASLGTINGTSNLIFDSALALDSANHRLYAGLQTAGAAIAIIDTTNDTVIGSLPATGSRSVAVDPVRGRVLVPDVGVLQVFEGGALARSVPFNWLPNLAVVDPATGDAWVTLNSGGIAVVDLAPGGTPRSGFVTSAGGDLYVDGLPYHFTGLNFYNANSDGWCRGAVDDATLDASLDAINLSFSGRGVIRAWFFQTLAVSEPSGARDWTRFDRLLREAASRGYKVIPTLADQWGECGARVDPTFAFKTEAWYTGGYAAPDPALASAHGGTWRSYRDWVAEVVGRYKDDATVAFWQLMNEAEVNPGGAFGVCPPGDGPRDELIDFATDMSGLVKSIDPEHLLSLGTIGGGQCGTSGPSTRTSTRSRTSTSANTTTTRRTRRSRATNGTVWACVSGSAPSWASHCSSARPGSARSMPGARSRTGPGRSRRRSSCNSAGASTGVVAWNWSPLGSTLDDYDIGPGDPALAALQEGRRLSYMVNTTDDDADDGICTREPLQPAGGDLRSNTNGFANSDIRFDIAGPAPHVIKPTTPLPAITYGRPHRRDVAARLHVGGADDRPQRGRRPGDRRAHGRRGPLGDPRPRDQRLRRGGHPVGRR